MFAHVVQKKIIPYTKYKYELENTIFLASEKKKVKIKNDKGRANLGWNINN